MRIAKIETAEVDIPLVTPFKTALRTVNSVNDIVVRVTADDGRTGFGEAPPTAVITGDTKGSIRCAIEEFIAPNPVSYTHLRDAATGEAIFGTYAEEDLGRCMIGDMAVSYTHLDVYKRQVSGHRVKE